MNSAVKIIMASTLLCLSGTTLAAKPTSIVFDSNGTADGKAYASYVAKCSNGKEVKLTAWDKRKKWCVGDATSTECQRKQIKAAKKACKSA